MKGLIQDVVLPLFQNLITVTKSAGYIGSAIAIALDAYNAIVTAKKIVIKTQSIPRCGKQTSTIKRHWSKNGNASTFCVWWRLLSLFLYFYYYNPYWL